MFRARLLVAAISLVCLLVTAGPAAQAGRSRAPSGGRAITTATAYQPSGKGHLRTGLVRFANEFRADHVSCEAS